MSIRKSIKYYYKKLIIKIFSIIYKKPSKFITSKNFYVTKIKNNKGLTSTYKIFKENKVNVFSDDLYNISIFRNDTLISNCSLQLDVKGNKKNKKENYVFKNGTPKIKRNIKGPVLILSQGASGYNYFHWFFDILPKIYIVKKKYNLNYFNYLYLPKIKFDYQKQTLNILKIPIKKILDSKKNKHFYSDEIVTCEHPYFKKSKWWDNYTNIPDWIVNENLKNFKKNQIKNNSAKIYKKIYIDRSDTTHPHNQISNIKEIYKILKKYNFKIIKLAHISFNNQIKLFNNAKIIIAPHGAGLKNLIYCKKKTVIIELKEKSFSKNHLYQHLSKICELKHFTICSKKYANRRMFIDKSMILNILKKYE
tara:strand:- start:1762 stop:2853 length:1092 start_codon:yes stop_codon:yes gene_type:complete